jgi:diphthine synthase
MLYLISLGLMDEKDISLRALETAKKCDLLYAEFYTNRTATSVERLSGLVGKPVKELERSGLEDDSGKLIEEAKNRDIGIFMPGDALSATTHIMLLGEARKAGVETQVIHGSSILTAVGETGLQLYKFGRTVTLTKPVQKSTLEAIEQNRKAGLHSLVLLDIEMDALEGLELMKGFLRDTKVIIATQLGGRQVIKYGMPDDLLKISELKGRIPAVLIVPGKLHFAEEEFLKGL